MPFALARGCELFESRQGLAFEEAGGHVFDQVARFTETAVHALTTERARDVRSVTSQPNSPATETACQAALEVRYRTPLDLARRLLMPGSAFGEQRA